MLVVTDSEDVNVELSARNIPGVQVSTAQGLNVLDITSADSVIITESAAKKVDIGARIMEARDVLKRPVITEKSSEAMAEDKYTLT